MKVDKLKQDSGGGFLDLSDWNMKSRKKFYKTPDLSGNINLNTRKILAFFILFLNFSLIFYRTIEAEKE